MSDLYLLECGCGKQLSVGARNAGQSVRCECGNTIPVPSLRELRRLPLVQRGERRKPTAWSRIQGFTFAAGSLVMAIALCVFFYYLAARIRVDMPLSPYDRFLDQKDLTSLTPEDTWLVWQAFQHYDIRWGHSQSYVDAQQHAARLQLYMGIAAGVALLGGIVVAVATFGMKPARRRAT